MSDARKARYEPMWLKPVQTGSDRFRPVQTGSDRAVMGGGDGTVMVTGDR